MPINLLIYLLINLFINIFINLPHLLWLSWRAEPHAQLIHHHGAIMTTRDQVAPTVSRYKKEGSIENHRGAIMAAWDQVAPTASRHREEAQLKTTMEPSWPYETRYRPQQANMKAQAQA